MPFRVNIDSIITEKALFENFVDSTFYVPEDDQEERFGRIFMAIEVRGNHALSRTLRRIIFDTLIQYYYKDLDIDPEIALENSIKEINVALQDVMQSDGQDWFDDLHVVLGVVVDDVMHVSVCGEAEAWLVRGKHCLSISEGLVESHDPEHCFQNIASGELHTGDMVLLTNTELPVLIRQAVGDWKKHYDLQAVMQRIETELQKYPYSILGMSFEGETEMITRVEVPQINNPSYVHKAKLAFSTLKEIFFPQDDDITGKKHDHREDQHIEDDEYDQEQLTSRDVRGYGETSGFDDLKNALSQFEVKKHASSNNRWKNTLTLLQRNVEALFASSTKIRSRAQRKNSWYMKFFEGNNFLLTVIAIIVFVTMYSVYSQYQENQSSEEVRAELSKIDDRLKEVKAKNATNEKAIAQNLLGEIEKTLLGLKEKNILANEIQDKMKEVQLVQDRVNEITRIENPEEYADLNKKLEGVKANSVFALGDMMYATSDKVLFKILLSEVQMQPLSYLKGNEVISFSVPFPEEKSILIVTSQNRVFEFKDDAFSEAKLTGAETKWKPIDQIVTFGRRLYVLDTKNNELWRYTKSNVGFSDPLSYKPGSDIVSLENTQDMSIDGDIYYLQKNGDVIRTRSQKQEEFAFEKLPSNLDRTKFTKIQKSSLLKQLFLLSPSEKKLLVVGAKGFYARQYLFDSLPEIQSFYVEENERRLYLLTPQKIYVVSIDS